jgi:hypothetical protein
VQTSTAASPNGAISSNTSVPPAHSRATSAFTSTSSFKVEDDMKIHRMTGRPALQAAVTGYASLHT